MSSQVVPMTGHRAVLSISKHCPEQNVFKVYVIFKGILTQRGMLSLKDGYNIVYSDGVSHKLWQSQGDKLHPIVLQKSHDVARSPFAQCCTLPECHLCGPTLA